MAASRRRPGGAVGVALVLVAVVGGARADEWRRAAADPRFNGTRCAAGGVFAAPGAPCGLNAPFGKVAVAADGRLVQYAEIPKTGSSSIKAVLVLKRFGAGDRAGGFAAPPRGAPAFAVVREPLERFLSGYGTVLHRGRPQLEAAGLFVAGDSAVANFRRYVNFVAAAGDDVGRYPSTPPLPEPCLWHHTLPQTWFLDRLWPRELDFVLRLERLDADFAAMRRRLPLKTLARHYGTRTVPRKNPREGGLDLAALRADPASRRALRAYLARDYACLGYPQPA